MRGWAAGEGGDLEEMAAGEGWVAEGEGKVVEMAGRGWAAAGRGWVVVGRAAAGARVVAVGRGWVVVGRGEAAAGAEGGRTHPVTRRCAGTPRRYTHKGRRRTCEGGER